MSLPYPPLLTKANWDKQKGIIAKILKSDTGVGAACEKAERAYKAIKWDEFSNGGLMRAKTQVDCMKAINGVKATYKERLMPLSMALMDLSKVATSAAAEFKKKTLIPKSSRENTEKIAAAAKDFAQTVVNYGEKLMRQIEFTEPIVANQVNLKLEEVLVHPKLKVAFRAFCMRQGAETYLFVEAYGNSPPAGKKAEIMFQKFIAEGAKHKVNIASALEKKFFAAARSPSPTRFDACPWAAARLELWNDMHINRFQDFRKANLLSILS